MANIETIKNIKVGNVLHPLDATYLDGHPMGDFQLKSDMGGWSEAVTAEETARKAADATLQANIDKKVSKDDETWLENFIPKIILNKNGTVESVTIGDNVTANYATISARLSRYGGVVIGTTIYQDNTPKGRVVQVHSEQGQSFPNVLYVTAIYNYRENFSGIFANSIYEIVLNYNSEGTFVSGTYKFKPISEVFEIGLGGRSPSELTINKTYEDFQRMDADYLTNGTLPLIILNDGWTRSNFILTRYYSEQYGDAQHPQWVFQLSFIGIRDKQLIGYYIVVEKDKTTVTPFEFQAQTQEDLEAATNKIAKLEENVTKINNNFQGMAEHLQPIIEGLETGKQDTISDLETIRANAANGQTAFGWGDHSKAGYVKPFIITLTGDGSTENPYAIDKTFDEIAAAYQAKSLILLDDGSFICVAAPISVEAENMYLTFAATWADDNALWAYYIQGDAQKIIINRFDFSYVLSGNLATINGENLENGGKDIKVGVPTIRAGIGAGSEVFNGREQGAARGVYSHAEGNGVADGDYSHAEGSSFASGDYSHAEGHSTVAKRQNSHAEGSYNILDDAAIHSVGIGTGAYERRDAHRITYDGKHYILGIGGFDGTKATENLTNEKDLATIINNYESRIAALETALAGVQSQLKSI